MTDPIVVKSKPIVVKTDEIDMDLIDEDSVKVIRRLRRHGHDAYLVGGCVRDLLNGVEPKDFDVITSARPRQVRRLFGNSRVIGRRFRLVHVIFGSNIIEVSTFRADPDEVAKRQEDEDENAPEAEGEAILEEAAEADLEGDADLEDEGDAEADLEDDSDLEDEGDAEADLEDDADLEDEGDAEADLEDDADADDQAADNDDAELGEQEDAGAESDTDADGEDEDDRPRGGRRRKKRRERDDSEFEANNMFGEPDQDARRRDFTINALLFDPDEQTITDYVGGLEDSKRRLVNPIRDPEEAFAEDPVRMIRAVRFAAKLNFDIADNAKAAIASQGHLVAACSQRRLLEEIFKILGGGYAAASLEILRSTGLDAFFWPEVASWVEASPAAIPLVEGEAVADGEDAEDAEDEDAEDADADAEDADAEDADAEDEDAEATDAEDEDDEDDDEDDEATEDAEEDSGEESSKDEAEPSEPVDPRETWGEPREISVGSATPVLQVFPGDAWTPDSRLVDAYMRVTWERPLPEGANDWVEDPHVFLEDALLEAAAFARQVHYDYLGRPSLGGVTSERERASDVLRVLRWEGRIDDIVAAMPEPKTPRRRRRRAIAAREQDFGTRSAPVVPAHLTRGELLAKYLEQMDHLTDQGVPLSNAVRLTVLFAPLLLSHLDTTFAADPRAGAEEATDDLLNPMARRHSLARKDRDRIKRITIVLRRLMSGELAERSKGRDRLLAREHFREAIVVLWIHLRALDLDLAPFHYWQAEAKRVPIEKSQRQPRRRGGGGGGGGGGDGRRRRRRR